MILEELSTSNRTQDTSELAIVGAITKGNISFGPI